jgi:hypothetical protein
LICHFKKYLAPEGFLRDAKLTGGICHAYHEALCYIPTTTMHVGALWLCYTTKNLVRVAAARLT